MDLFGDKQYEELDWLTKAIEPIADTINEKLQSLPDIVNVDVKIVANKMQYNYLNRLSVSQLLTSANLKITEAEMYYISKYYDVVSDDVIVDYDNNTVVGTVYLQKTSVALSEKDAKERLSNVVERATLKKRSILFDFVRYESDQDGITNRLNEVLDVLDSKDGLRARSLNSKQDILIYAIRDAFKTDKFKVRDVQLAENITNWMYEYVQTGDLSKITNLCRIKVMAYNGKPIYKFEETI